MSNIPVIGPYKVDNTASAGGLSSPGPYVGTIMDNEDPTCMGRMRVWIPELAKTPPDNDTGWITVAYAPPFYGATNLKTSTENNVTNTSQSYGMWFVPPDVGVSVLVMFVNSDPRRGYWFACVPNVLMNHMIPGIASRAATAPDAPDLDPITEYNKNIDTFTNQETVYAEVDKSPSHLVQAAVLFTQGLSLDEARGPSMSTVRRETPTSVFGISTPGRVTSRMSDRYDAGIEYRTVTGREGGHQFVMDDGDALGQSQGIRLRSAKGGMVLINDTIGSVYIINQEGTAWAELTANGRIDVYGKGSVNIHSEKDINLTADNDVNILATNSFNVVATNINTEAVDQRHFGKAKFYQRSPDMMMESDSLTLIAKLGSGGGNTKSNYGSGLTIQAQNGTMQFINECKTSAGKDITFETATKFQVNSTGALTLKTGSQLELDAFGGIVEAVKAGSGTIAQFTIKVDQQMQANDTGGDNKFPTGWTPVANWKEGDSTPVETLKKDDRSTAIVDIPKPYTSGVEQSHVPITPQHEPWRDHEVNVSSSATLAPSGSVEGGSLFANGSGVAFPEDTTKITSGSKKFALSETLAQFEADMNINFEAYAEDTAATASRGRYETMPDGKLLINDNGYIGRYQMSMSMLKGLGVTTSDTQSADAVNQTSNWTPSTKEITSPSFNSKPIMSPPKTPQLGPGSAAGFLQDSALQDKSFIAANYINYATLKKLGIITGKESPAERAGWLKATLFMGLGNKQNYSKFAPGMQLTAEEARKLTTDSQGLGNGVIGLYVHWKILGRPPTAHNYRDRTGASTYTYYSQGSKTQTG